MSNDNPQEPTDPIIRRGFLISANDMKAIDSALSVGMASSRAALGRAWLEDYVANGTDLPAPDGAGPIELQVLAPASLIKAAEERAKNEGRGPRGLRDIILHQIAQLNQL